jgi:pimeloyl-ACP methyl ester carboxylesterase
MQGSQSRPVRRLLRADAPCLGYTFAPGSGTPLLFLHANRTNRRIFDFVIDAMGRSNPILVPDYRGHGDSDREAASYALDDHLADIVAVCDDLELDRFAVVGQATGGTLALLLASKLPERVVAVAAGDFAIRLRPDVMALLERQVNEQRAGFASGEEALAATPFRTHWTPEVAAHWIATALERRADGRLHWRYHPDGVLATHRELTGDLWPRIAVRQPTLLFRGARCEVIDRESFEIARRVVPQAEIAELPDADHRLSQDNPDGFARLVGAFLTRCGVLA